MGQGGTTRLQPGQLWLKLWRAIYRPAYLPTALALVVLTLGWIFVEQQNRNVYELRAREDVRHRLELIRTKLEGNIDADTMLIRGLVASIAVEPEMSQERFTALARQLWPQQKTKLRNLAALPDYIVTYVYPLEGNQKVLGIDLSKHPTQAQAAFRARDTGEMVLAGPTDLVQGGQGFVARYPVFVDDGAGGRRFWGVVSSVLDVEDLYRKSGIFDKDLPIQISLTGRDATGSLGAHFYGDPFITQTDPVNLEVHLPIGSWQLSAIPKDGWPTAPDNVGLVRLAMLIAGALILVPTIISGRLAEERWRNVGNLERGQRDMKLLSHRLNVALDNSHIGVWELNVETGGIIWDDRMNEIYGYPQDGGRRDPEHWTRRVHPDDLERALAEVQATIDTGTDYISDFRIVLDDGEIRHIRATAAIFEDPGAPRCIIGVNQDVSADVALRQKLKTTNDELGARNAEVEAAKERIEFNALHDQLTGLPNRRYLEEALRGVMSSTAGRKSLRTGILHIDLHRFNQINDTLGYAAGDRILRHAAKVLTELVGREDVVTRVGADEFVILCNPMRMDRRAWHARLAQLADHIVVAMRRPFQYEGHPCHIGASIGIAAGMTGQDDTSRLLVNADIALHRAKKQGGDRHCFFSSSLQSEIIATQRTADDILSGLERGEFVPYYQPQFDAATMEVIGVEALARWRHPTSGILVPAAFMETAEELNVVATIDRLILEQALEHLRGWQADGVPLQKVSVNVSTKRLKDEELIKGLRKLKIRPGTISFELLEAIFLDEKDDLMSWNLEQIKDLGIDIEIDDFGTGYASILGLMELNPRRLKIARQIVGRTLGKSGHWQLLGSIIDIGRALGIEVLAEGVETMEQVHVLRGLGCSALQGYALGRPMSEKNLRNFIATRAKRHADVPA